jgi:FeS assembly SUF system regulator
MADYGVVLGTRLASLPLDELRSVRDLAAETGIPQPTVSKILKLLARHGVVDGVRGAHGGYRLARPPEDVSVAEVIEAVEGPIGVTECGSDDDDCELSARCDVRGNWQRINQAIQQALEAISLVEMAQPPSHVLVALGRRGPDGLVQQVDS